MLYRKRTPDYDSLPNGTYEIIVLVCLTTKLCVQYNETKNVLCKVVQIINSLHLAKVTLSWKQLSNCYASEKCT